MSNLATTFDEIRSRIGKALGYGTGKDSWTDRQIEDITFALKDGQRMFYNESSHDWSFLKPVESFTIPSGVDEVRLPSRFGFLASRIYFAADENVGPELIVESAPKVLARRQQDETSTGPPIVAAIDERKPGETHGQQKYLMVWPTTDAAYTLRMQYSVLVDELTEDSPHPWGGAAHAKTITHACLAAAEQMSGTIGIETALYERALRGSIDFDRKVKPQTLTESMETGVWPRPAYVTYTPGV